MAQTDGFVPSVAPSQSDPNLSSLVSWIERELGRIASVLQAQSILTISPLFEEPPKPRDGMMVYADGTEWDPGSGEGSYVRTNGAWVPAFDTTPAIAVLVESVVVQKFEADGTYTPTTGMHHAILECVGSGGGGGSADAASLNVYNGSGGNSGGYSRKYVTAADIGVSKTVTVGAAGAGGAAGSNNGAAGGDVSVGSLCIAKGGPGGKFGSVSQVAIPNATVAVAGTGDVVAAGNVGGTGLYSQAASYVASGNGASSVLGGGAPGVWTGAGVNAGNYGSGGSGASSVIVGGLAGGNGSKGIVIITEFIRV